MSMKVFNLSINNRVTFHIEIKKREIEIEKNIY